MRTNYDMRSDAASEKTTISVVEDFFRPMQSYRMLGKDELLATLEAQGTRKVDMARALGLPSSRIAEMYAGKRGVSADESKTLHETFGLDGNQAPPISEQTGRLLVLHVAIALGVALQPDNDLVQELSLDLQAFSKFARAHLPSPSPDATSGFLYSRRASRPERRTAEAKRHPGR